MPLLLLSAPHRLLPSLPSLPLLPSAPRRSTAGGIDPSSRTPLGFVMRMKLQVTDHAGSPHQAPGSSGTSSTPIAQSCNFHYGKERRRWRRSFDVCEPSSGCTHEIEEKDRLAYLGLVSFTARRRLFAGLTHHPTLLPFHLPLTAMSHLPAPQPYVAALCSHWSAYYLVEQSVRNANYVFVISCHPAVEYCPSDECTPDFLQNHGALVHLFPTADEPLG